MDKIIVKIDIIRGASQQMEVIGIDSMMIFLEIKVDLWTRNDTYIWLITPDGKKIGYLSLR